MNNTIIQFYRCYGCGKIRFIEDIEAGKNCQRCGGWHIRYSNPTFLSKIEMFIRYPKYIAIWWKENVLGK